MNSDTLRRLGRLLIQAADAMDTLPIVEASLKEAEQKYGRSEALVANVLMALVENGDRS